MHRASASLFVWQIHARHLAGDERVVDAIVLLLGQCLVIGMVCYFVGVLADQQRAEQAQVEWANAQLAEANQQAGRASPAFESNWLLRASACSFRATCTTPWRTPWRA